MKRSTAFSRFLICIFSLFLSFSFPPPALSSYHSPLALLAPGDLVAPVIRRLPSRADPVHYEHLRQVDWPIIDGVFHRLDPTLLKGEERIMYEMMQAIRLSLEQDLFPPLSSKNMETENACVDEASLSSTCRSQSWPFLVQDFIAKGYDHKMVPLWKASGRWSSSSNTLCEPWVWNGVDVFWASKVIPYGWWILTPTNNPQHFIETDRNNLGGVSNSIGFLANWANVFKRTLELLILPQPEVKQQPLPLSASSSFIRDFYATYKPIHDKYPVLLIAEEPFLDLTEIFVRGPALIGTLLYTGELAFAYQASFTYAREVYDALNRNRKLFMLHPLGSAYLYSALNMISLPLLTLDPWGFYLEDIPVKWRHLKAVEAFSPAFYARLVTLTAKVISPAFGISQLYNPKMRAKTFDILQFLQRNSGPIGRGAARLASFAQKNLALPAPLLAPHRFLKQWGPSIYNVCGFITGTVGGTVAIAALEFEAWNARLQHPWASGVLTGISAFAYQAMYWQWAADLPVFHGVTLRQIFIGTQVALLTTGIVWDYGKALFDLFKQQLWPYAHIYAPTAASLIEDEAEIAVYTGGRILHALHQGAVKISEQLGLTSLWQTMHAWVAPAQQEAP